MFVAFEEASMVYKFYIYCFVALKNVRSEAEY